MKTIVTGGKGFIGKHTVSFLKKMKMEVAIVDHHRNPDNDMRDADVLRKVIQPGDKILHLAAVSSFAKADKNPQHTYDNNVFGTCNVIKIAQECGASQIVHASTGSVYMPVTTAPIHESHRILGNSHYGVSKRLAEELYRSFADSIPYTILRYAHVFGKGKGKRGLVGVFIDRMKRGAAPILYGGKQSNDFIYVKDIAYANFRALVSEPVNSAVNIGTGFATTTEECVEALKRATGYEGEIDHRPLRSVDAMEFKYDTELAQRVLKFKAHYTLDEGLEDMKKMGVFD